MEMWECRDNSAEKTSYSGKRRGDSLVAPLRRVVDTFLKGTLVVGDALRAAPKPKLLAKIVAALGADRAAATRDSDLKRNSVAKLEARNLGPYRDDHPGRLVSQRQRMDSTEVAVGEFFVVGDIGAADACRFDGNLELPKTRLFNLSLFLLNPS